jgi:hypothetical protein
MNRILSESELARIYRILECCQKQDLGKDKVRGNYWDWGGGLKFLSMKN